MTAELGRLVGFGRYLRDLGLPVGTGRILTFTDAVGVLQPLDERDLYWAARTTLVASRADLETFDRAFETYFRSAGEQPLSVPGDDGPPTASRTDGNGAGAIRLDDAAWAAPDDDEDARGEVGSGLRASAAEVLRNRSFEELSEDERLDASAMIRRLAVTIPERRSRRLRAGPRGANLDIRRTLRRSLRTMGEPVRRAWRHKRTRMRPLVLILDVSGSMSPYSRALLQFGFAATAAGHEVEVFCFGTRLTRITPSLRTKDPSRALKEVAAVVHDWEGGTRIGDSLSELIQRYGQRSSIRGAVVVLCSDGLERGDPEVLTAAMSRLARLAHRVVWVNPLKGSDRYEPVARGMAAALPYVDLFLSGHNVASLEALAGVLRDRKGSIAARSPR